MGYGIDRAVFLTECTAHTPFTNLKGILLMRADCLLGADGFAKSTLDTLISINR